MNDYVKNMKKGAIIGLAMLTLNGCSNDISDTLRNKIDESRHAVVDYINNLAQKDQYNLKTLAKMPEGNEIYEGVYKGDKLVMTLILQQKGRIKPGDNHGTELEKLGLERSYEFNQISAELAKKYPLKAEPETNLHNPSGYLPLRMILNK
jgi:di/tripeptidase